MEKEQPSLTKKLLNVFEKETWNAAIEAAASLTVAHCYSIDLANEIRKLRK